MRHRTEYRSLKLDGRIGIALSTDFAMPFDELLESDVIAAERANIFHIDWLLNPLLTGDWPEEMKDAAGSRLPGFSKAEELKVKGSIDFIVAVHKTSYLATSYDAQTGQGSTDNQAISNL